MTQTPTIAAAIRAMINASISGLHVSLPARVESYDPANTTITAQPLVRQAYTDESGDRQTELLPPITGVPVMFPGSGAHRVTWPMAKGDTVLLVFSDQSIDTWLVRGGVVDPGDDRRHTLSDAIAIPGLYPFPSAAPAGTAAMVLETPAEIRLGSDGATDPVALTSQIAALKAAIVSALNGIVAGAGAPVAAVVTTGAVKVRAE